MMATPKKTGSKPSKIDPKQAGTIKGGRTPSLSGPVPIPYPNSKS
jgi:hypothetical protein